MTDSRVPDGWLKGPLEDFMPLQRGFDLPTPDVVPGPVPVVYSNGIGRFHNQWMVNGPGVVTGRSGTIGKVHLVEPNYWPHNTALWVTRFDRCEPRYTYQYLQYLGLSRFASGSGVPTLNRNDVHSLVISIPRDRNERIAIARALAETDHFVDLLERLIVKKQAMKQGMLKSLLTGRTRLPTFIGEWSATTFGEVATPSRERVSPREVEGRVIELEHLSSGMGTLLGDADVRSAVSLKTAFVPGDVLFGKLRAYLRKYWLADRSGYCSTEIWALRSRPGVSLGSYLRYVVEMTEFIQTASTAYGTHMPRSDWTVVSQFGFDLPPIDEQRAIAEVLLSVDREIEVLERRLKSARSLKRGMMQELLTGRTRLKSPEVAA